MIKKRLAAIGAALILHGVAYAATAASGSSTSGAGSTDNGDAPAGTWAAQGQLGLILSRGNTVANSGNASFDEAHSVGRWVFTGGFAAIYASTNSITTQQDTSAHLQSNLQLSKRTFWFSNTMYDRNLFTGFAYQESVASGGGYNLIATPATQFSAELGGGYRRQEPELLTKNTLGGVISRVREPTAACPACGTVVKDAVLVAALKYEHAITATTKVLNTVQVLSGSSDTLTTDNLSLQVKVDASLSLAVGLQLINNTNPPPGNVSHTDTVMTVNLVYALKNSKLSPTATTPLLTNVNMFDLP